MTDRAQLGDTVDMRGPKGNLTYLGSGNFRIKRRDDRQVRIKEGGGGGDGVFDWRGRNYQYTPPQLCKQW